MPKRSRSLVCAALLLGLGGAPACAAPKPEPEFASSANHGHYAREFPDTLNAVAKDFSDRRIEARKVFGELNGYPSKLKDVGRDGAAPQTPPQAFWAHVLEIIQRADEDGHSHAYVARLRRVSGASAFFEAEIDDINRKVVGSVAFVAKKKGCDESVAGAAPPALKDVVEKQLEKELHEASEAHRILERHRGELGKENAAALEKQADEIARASYIVHIELVEDKLRLQRMMGEVEQIRKTADDAIAAERAYQSSYKKITEPEKKASQARIDEMNKSKASLDAAVKQAEAVIPTVEDEIKKIQKEYDDALSALEAKIKEKIH